ncbi:MAG: hypothetical protein JW893_01720 [Candidatus Omnitrophica bacterium]|nr:hypothetical protein [Candidatus Omnitrophota bacterium]
MNPEYSLSEIISFSWKKTREILLPFRFRHWLKILLVIWFAGQGIHSGSIPSGNVPNTAPERSQQQVMDTFQTDDEQTLKADENAEMSDAESPMLEEVRGLLQKAKPFLLFLIPLIIFLWFFVTWLGARLNFVFLDLMTKKEISIRQSFREQKQTGNSYFLWLIGFFAALLFCLLLFFGAGVLARQNAFLIFAIVVLGAGSILTAAVLSICISDFVLPLMYQDRIPTLKAIGLFFSYRPRIKQIALYLGVKLLLGIVAMVAVVIVSLIIGLLAGIVSFLVVMVGLGLVAMIPFLKPGLFVVGLGFAVLAFIVVFISIGMLTLPAPIFMKAFALNFLIRFCPGYHLLGFPCKDESSTPFQ